MSLKEIIRLLIPPVLPLIARSLGFRKGEFRGEFSSWEQATQHASGYATPQILSRAIDARRKVKSGEALFERDTVLFQKPEYNFELLFSLLYVASRSNGMLTVLDFGGALGSTYFQNRDLLESCTKVEWSVVELPDFVQAGKVEAQEGTLRFFETMEEFSRERRANVLLLSSVLQYLGDPHRFLNECAAKKIPFIIIDRTPMWMDDRPDRIMIQRVDPSIFDARFPVRILNGNHLLESAPGYEIVTEYTLNHRADLSGMKYRGVLLRLKDWEK